MTIPIDKPDLGDEEARAVQKVIRTGWVTQGPAVERFEQTVAEYCGTAEAVATSSGTTALHLALLALGIGPGDEVICPSLSFIATANAICHAGAEPVFADVDPQTYNLDADATAAAITPRTRAILVVHQVGLPADLDRFLEIGHRRDVAIIEDAACALGSRYRGRAIGGHGDLACFSFHPRKVITTGEGGMVMTNDPWMARRLRRLRNHDHGGSSHANGNEQTPDTASYAEPGHNFRMSDIHAAIGQVQMTRLDGLVRRRRELAARYDTALAEHPYVRPPLIPDYAEPNFQSYTVSLTDDAPLGRDDLIHTLREQGVAAGSGIMLAHRQEAHHHRTGADRLPHSETAHDHSLLLPLFPQLAEPLQDDIIRLIYQTFSLKPRSSRHGR